MADTLQFFEKYLPEKLIKKPDLWSTVKASFQFDIDGAGSWFLDLTSGPGSVKAGQGENPGVTIAMKKDDWEKMLDNPGSAMSMFMMGKIKIKGSTGLAMQLQKILA